MKNSKKESLQQRVWAWIDDHKEILAERLDNSQMYDAFPEESKTKEGRATLTTYKQKYRNRLSQQKISDEHRKKEVIRIVKKEKIIEKSDLKPEIHNLVAYFKLYPNLLSYMFSETCKALNKTHETISIVKSLYSLLNSVDSMEVSEESNNTFLEWEGNYKKRFLKCYTCNDLGITEKRELCDNYLVILRGIQEELILENSKKIEQFYRQILDGLFFYILSFVIHNLSKEDIIKQLIDFTMEKNLIDPTNYFTIFDMIKIHNKNFNYRDDCVIREYQGVYFDDIDDIEEVVIEEDEYDYDKDFSGEIEKCWNEKRSYWDLDDTNPPQQEYHLLIDLVVGDIEFKIPRCPPDVIKEWLFKWQDKNPDKKYYFS